MNNQICEKKNIRLILMCVLVLIASFFIYTDKSYAATYWESETNDYIGNADYTNVYNGNIFKGELDSSDIDFIKFDVEKGSQLNVKFNGSKPNNTGHSRGICIEIYNENNIDNYIVSELVEYNENLGYIYDNYNFYLAEGTYYMKVYEDWLYEDLEYSMTFNNKEWENFKESNNYIGQATNITDSKLYCGIIDESNNNGGYSIDADFFKVKVNTAGKYYITLKNINIPDSAVYDFGIETFNSEGNSVRRLNDNCEVVVCEGNTKTILTNLPKGTTYFKVSSDYYSGKYSLCISKRLPAPAKTYRRLYGHDDVRLSWSKVDGATGYKIYYKKASANSYTYWKSVNTTVAKKSGLKDGYKYVFKIVPYKKINGKIYNGNYKTTNSIYTLKKVSDLRFEKNGTKVKVKWDGINGESGYQVYKMKKSDGSYKKVSSYKTTKSYLNISAKKGKTYYYKVRAYKKVTVDGETKTIYAPWSKVKSFKR